MYRQLAFSLVVSFACDLCLVTDISAQMKTFWPDPVANEMVPYLTGQLTHGPMLGRPTATSMQVNNILKSGRPDGPGYHFVAYDAPTAVIRFHDAYTGKLLYAEAVFTLDARQE